MRPALARGREKSPHMCAACRSPLALNFCLTLGCSCCHVLAAKSIFDRLGIDQTNDDENSTGQQLYAQPATQLPRAAALALTFQGSLRPDALMPVVVQPRLINSAAYTAPHAGDARVLANPVREELLRGRGGA